MTPPRNCGTATIAASATSSPAGSTRCRARRPSRRSARRYKSDREFQTDGRSLYRRVRASSQRGRTRRPRPGGGAHLPHLRNRQGLHDARPCGRAIRVTLSIRAARDRARLAAADPGLLCYDPIRCLSCPSPSRCEPNAGRSPVPSPSAAARKPKPRWSSSSFPKRASAAAANAYPMPAMARPSPALPRHRGPRRRYWPAALSRRTPARAACGRGAQCPRLRLHRSRSQAQRDGRPINAWGCSAAPAADSLHNFAGDARPMAAAAAAASTRPLLKVKLGGDGDPERIAAVRRAARHAELIVDANEGWRPAESRPQSRGLRGGGRHPRRATPAGRPTTPRSQPPRGRSPSVPTKACMTAPRLRNWWKYDAVNIKLDKAGGLTEAIALAEAAGPWASR